MQDDDVIMIEEPNVPPKPENNDDDYEIECLYIVDSSNNPPPASPSIQSQHSEDIEVLYQKKSEIDIYDIEDDEIRTNNDQVCYEIDDDDEIIPSETPQLLSIQAEIHQEPSSIDLLNQYETEVRDSINEDLITDANPNSCDTDVIIIEDPENEATNPVIELEDDIDDENDIPILDVDEYQPVYKTVATIDLDQYKKPKNPVLPKVTEDPNQIFKRIMPTSLPGVAMLFTPDRHLLPENVRPTRYNYYFFISPHLVVKEMAKTEYYHTKEQMFMAKKNISPCTCLSHPLNQNASRLTLLTNPHSLFHRQNCYFSQKNSENRVKRPSRGVRRLSYQFTLNRMPQKSEAKDFKCWSDVVIRRRIENQSASNTEWGSDNLNSDLLKHHPFKFKVELKKEEPSEENQSTEVTKTNPPLSVIKTES